MKRIIAFCLALIVAITILCGCGYNKPTTNNSGSDGRMLLVYNDGFSTIYVDTKTGTQYFSKSDAGTCVMVDLDGNPVHYPAFDAMEDAPNG